MSLLNDRLTRGFMAGLIGYIPLTIFNQSMYFLKISKLRYLDFASVFIYGHKCTSTLEALFSYFVTMFFTSALGIIFAFLIPTISNRNIVFKGFLFSSGSWFLIYAVTILFKISEVSNVDLLTAISNLMGAAVWGIALGYALLWLDKKGKQKSR
ncbi:MAG: hypothetical protein AAGU27_05625 [Dehalobacterium sp.]